MIATRNKSKLQARNRPTEYNNLPSKDLSIDRISTETPKRQLLPDVRFVIFIHILIIFNFICLLFIYILNKYTSDLKSKFKYVEEGFNIKAIEPLVGMLITRIQEQQKVIVNITKMVRKQ